MDGAVATVGAGLDEGAFAQDHEVVGGFRVIGCGGPADAGADADKGIGLRGRRIGVPQNGCAEPVHGRLVADTSDHGCKFMHACPANDRSLGQGLHQFLGDLVYILCCRIRNHRIIEMMDEIHLDDHHGTGRLVAPLNEGGNQGCEIGSRGRS